MADTTPDAAAGRTTVEPAVGAPDEAHRNPWLAVLGAGDAAMTAVARAVTDAFSAATSRQKTVQQRVADLPTELDGLRARFSGDELRRALDTYRLQLERAYAGFSGRGEEAWERLREHPPVRQAIAAIEAYTEKLDVRVDGLVDDAQGAASRALATAGRQTRVTGEKVARAGQRFSGRAADAVVDASAATAGTVETVGANAAEVIEEAGDETAAVTRKATPAAEAAGPDAPSGGTTTSSGVVPPARRTATPRQTPRRPGPASE